jgi:predicted porin
METPLKIATGLGLAVAATVMATAARAQSNVTVSGWVHVAVTHMNNGTSPFGGGAGKPDAWSLGNDDSALVIKGTEDLGGGMKARFHLDHRFNADDGTGRTGGTLTRPFWWTASVALDTPFGSIELGRQYTLFSKVAFFGDPSGWMGVSQVPMLQTPNLYPANDIVNISNAVAYTTPQFGPLQASIQVAPNEGPVPGREIGLRVEYADGPAYAALAFDTRKPPGAPAERLAIFTGSYDLGVIKPIVSLARAEVGGQSDSDAYLIGSVIRLSGASTLHASWIVGHMPAAGFDGGAEVKKLGLQYRYSLSKRTMLFTSVGSSRQEQATRTTGYDFGLHHDF